MQRELFKYIYINNNSEIPLYKYSHSSLCVCPDESLWLCPGDFIDKLDGCFIVWAIAIVIFKVLYNWGPGAIASEGSSVADDYKPMLSSCQGNIDPPDVREEPDISGFVWSNRRKNHDFFLAALPWVDGANILFNVEPIEFLKSLL